MCRANNSWAVPTLSSVKDCIRDMCTPKSRWMPLHSMHTIIPKFVDNHVASASEARLSFNATKRRDEKCRVKFRQAEISATTNPVGRTATEGSRCAMNNVNTQRKRSSFVRRNRVSVVRISDDKEQQIRYGWICQTQIVRFAWIWERNDLDPRAKYNGHTWHASRRKADAFRH